MNRLSKSPLAESEAKSLKTPAKSLESSEQLANTGLVPPAGLQPATLRVEAGCSDATELRGQPTSIDQSSQILSFYRRVMDRIHQGGNIFYDRDRMEAYALIARLTSVLRQLLYRPSFYKGASHE